VVRALDDHKAVDVLVLDLRKISNAADFFVIASGTSDTHVRALLDFVDVVVHVFHPTLRDYYQLERLWSDAPVVSFDVGE
jgi:ribosome-associated protein